MTELKGKTSIEAWKASVAYVIDKGRIYADADGRKFKQVLNVNLEITEPEKDITEPINILSRSEKWLYPKLDEIRSIFLMNKSVHSYEYTYGQRIFNYSNELKQIDDYIILFLKDKTHQMTRRLYVSLWNPLKDSKYDTGIEMPGLVGIWLKVHDRQLTMTGIIRNNNCFMGFPATLYQVYILQKYISDRTGLDPGSIYFYSLSMHILLDQLDDIKNMMGIE